MTMFCCIVYNSCVILHLCIKGTHKAISGGGLSAESGLVPVCAVPVIEITTRFQCNLDAGFFLDLGVTEELRNHEP